MHAFIMNGHSRALNYKIVRKSPPTHKRLNSLEQGGAGICTINALQL